MLSGQSAAHPIKHL